MLWGPIVLQNNKTCIEDFNVCPFDNLFFENVYILTKDNVKIGCWILGPCETDKNTKYLICLHSLSVNRKEFAALSEIDALIKLNYVLLIPDYRSFGDSNGSFIKEHINYDIEAVRNFCISRYCKDPCFLGHSFGGAIALQYLRYSKHDLKIVLIATFTTLLEVLNVDWIWTLYKQIVWNAEKHISKYFGYDNYTNIMYGKKENLMVFHGDLDKVIPMWHGIELAKNLGCQFVQVENGDQNSVFYCGKIFTKINDFIRNCL
ncbi:hypothetical protein COBT_002026 [Conglomerata obtusa]